MRYAIDRLTSHTSPAMRRERAPRCPGLSLGYQTEFGAGPELKKLFEVREHGGHSHLGVSF